MHRRNRLLTRNSSAAHHLGVPVGWSKNRIGLNTGMDGTVNDLELQAWVDRWRAEYGDDDSKIAHLLGKPTLAASDLEPLFEWKYRSMWPKRKIQAMRTFPADQLAEVTRRAFACQDELGALRILTLIPSVGPAGASAILMANDPERYTVMDVRAIKSLYFLGRWNRETFGSSASALGWPTYLATCLDLSEKSKRPLRDVDRALWAAKGRDTP